MTATRVMHVITGLETGGAERMLARLVLAPRAQPMDFAVVSLTPGGAVAERLKRADIPVFDLGMRRGFPDIRAVFRLARLMREWEPDAVQSWLYHADAVATLALLFSGRRKKTRLFWNLRCSSMEGVQRGLSQKMALGMCVLLSRLPDAVIANSEAGREFHFRIGYRPKKFLVVANGIDTGLFRPDPAARAELRRELGIAADAPVVAMIARVDPVKDHATFLAALEKLPHVTALAAGEGTETLPALPNLRRLGERADVPRILAASDLLVSTSLSEGFPNAILEGLAAGLPAVATDAGDSKRIVGDCGAVVPVGDAGTLAAAIEGLLNQPPAQRSALRDAARRRAVERFGLGRMAAAFDALYCGGP